MKYKTLLVVVVILVALAKPALATHIRAAEIIVEREVGSLTKFKITVIAYLNLQSMTPFGNGGNGYVDFGDGSRVLIPTTGSTPRPDLGPDIGIASYTVIHDYLTPGMYKVTYYERDRSAGVLNIVNAGDTPYSAYTEINTDPAFGLNTFPKLIINPVDRACPGITFFHSPGARDDEGDSLSYELTSPAGYSNIQPVYFTPDDPRFYFNYNTANEEENGPPTFLIDSESGLITWNAPGMTGEYNIAFKVIEWRRNPVTNILERLSITVRDMQILVQDCQNKRPNITVMNDLCIVAGTNVQTTLIASDPDYNDIKIEAVSEIFQFPTDPATLTPANTNFVPSPESIDFEWNTNCSHIREQPYQVVFKVSDKPNVSDGVTLVTFKTWSIRIIPPTPTGLNASLDLANRKSVLTWDPYTCQNAEKIQIWRKVGSFPDTSPFCVIGSPRSIGFELIDEVSPSQTTYIDSNSEQGLVAGALYCYRLVATFAAPAGGKSHMSDEVCIGPITVDAPVLTHVTVEKTSSNQGSIRVSWRSPYEIDKTQFPKPYYYEVYRAEGFTPVTPLIKITTDALYDTTFVDTGINTTDKIYNYTVVVYSKPLNVNSFIPIDTSATASSVRLEAAPGPQKITLSWSAHVPWSNTAYELPWHRIYKGIEGDTEDDLILIDSVNISENEFVYEDTDVIGDKIYYYRVETRGTYGNDDIGLLKNLSQTTGMYPENDLLPCKPVAAVVLIDCEKYLNEETCEPLDLNSSVVWQPVFENGCRLDIESYKVYGADSEDGEFTLIAENVRDTFFTETSLTSFARCYRVAAVDKTGQVSELSDAVCNENCPYYELPNVFTPDGNGYNDEFSAYYKPIPDDGKEHAFINRCPRFVQQVVLRVYNRWGREVYSYSSANGGSIYINWDGKSNTGIALDAEIYYYVADVTFQTHDPKKRSKTIRGWVHLAR
jgi:fibronectin type 3 domain-containing protein